MILPGFVNAHSHLEYAVYAGFGDGLPFAPWIGLHVRRKSELELADMEAIARVGAADCLRSGITTVGDASFSGAAATACAELGLRAIVYLEVFGGAEAVAERFEPMRERLDGTLPATVRLGVSPHAPYTCTPELYEACLALGLPVTTHLSESAHEAAYVRDGSGPWSELAELLVEPLGIERHPRARRARPARTGACSPRTASPSTTRRSRSSPPTTSPSRTARARTATSAAASRRCAQLRGAGLRVSIATDSPASTPGFDMFEELRAAVAGARAREHDAGALLGRRRARARPRSRGARALGLDDEVGSIVPGKQADLAVVSLEDSPLDPVEDAATAVVLGGSPDRVLATLVGGDERYRKGSTAWRDIRRAGRSARSRMLR